MNGLDQSKLQTSSRDKSIVESLQKLNEKELKLYKGEGCDKCGGTGYRGRIGIFEVLVMSEEISEMVLAHASSSKIHRQAEKEGMLNLQQDGILRVLEGATTLEEIMRVAK